jgi:glycosyltransferase involved in cell wall biosynthesis
VTPHIVTHGVNGLLACRMEDWEPALQSLISDPKLRQRLSAAGRTTVEKRFRVQRAAEAVNSVLRSLV